MRRTIATLAATALVAVPAVSAVAQDAPAGAAPVQRAQSVLPPGNSMLYTVDAFAAGNASGDPDDFGPNVDDQRELYWNYQFKDATFTEECAAPEQPRDGVRICWSEFGVPSVFADEDADLFYGSGWSAAKLRLFLIEAIVRTARGTLAALAGPGPVPQDRMTRYQTFSQAHYTAEVERLSPDARVAVDSYVEGVNDYIDVVTTTGADQLPAEYALLGAAPTKITAEDVMAIGVLMTRFVASEGRNEMRMASALRALEEEFGVQAGRVRFLDLNWQEDADATVTIHADEATFPRTSQTAAERDAAFTAMADYARTLPLDLEFGPGTDPPTEAARPGSPLGSIETPFAAAAAAPQVPNPAAMAAAALTEWTARLEGGSFMVMMDGTKTADDSTLLISEPQLGYDPVLLMEAQLVGGRYAARGVTVPGIPMIGIGYTPTVAWALTTGNAKTIDTFVETVRPDSDGDGAPEYLHDGTWKNTECRDETINWREAQQGVPVGPAVFSETDTICSTVHGPIVSPFFEDIDDVNGEPALSFQWHMAGREIDTIEGVLAWNRAETAADMEASVPQLTWNENVGWADSQGHIGFWHPGTHLTKAAGTDLRLPTPGSGEFDNGAPLPFTALPHLTDPDRGWIANWNNKPANGWLDGNGRANTSYPAGPGQRLESIEDAIASRDDWTFAELVELDRYVSSIDFRAKHFAPYLTALVGRSDLTATETAALAAISAWDGSANGDGADMVFAGYDAGDEPTTVGAANTVFEAFVEALIQDLFGDLRAATFPDDAAGTPTDYVTFQSAMGRHVYDVSPVLNLALRSLDPTFSDVATSIDYLRGRSADEVIRAAFAVAVTTVEADQGSDVSTWRRVYTNPSDDVCNPSGAIGPCGVMPFLERGTWIHYVGWDAPAGAAPAPAPAPAPETPLPTTGGGLAALAALILALGLALTRRGWRGSTLAG